MDPLMPSHRSALTSSELQDLQRKIKTIASIEKKKGHLPNVKETIEQLMKNASEVQTLGNQPYSSKLRKKLEKRLVEMRRQENVLILMMHGKDLPKPRGSRGALRVRIMGLLRLCCLIVSIIGVVSADTDCSREDSCFGDLPDCNPDSDCPSLFQFEDDGSMNLYLCDFDDPERYAAFAVDRHPDETIEYFICRPHQRKLVKALSELGGAVLFVEQNLTGFVEELALNYFRCHFNDYEMPPFFHDEQVFFLSNGTYDNEVMVILGGEQMYNLELDIEEDLDEFDEKWIIPTLDYMGTPIRRSIEKVEKTSEDVEKKASDSDSALKSAVRTKRYDAEEEELTNIEPDRSVFNHPVVEEDELFDAAEQQKKKYEVDETDSDEESRRLRKPLGRPSRYDQDDEDEDDEDDEEELHEKSFRFQHD